MSVLCLAAADLFRSRDALSLLLFLWLFGTFAFAVFFPDASKRGAWNQTWYDCHSPGRREAFRLGADPPTPWLLIHLW